MANEYKVNREIRDDDGNLLLAVGWVVVLGSRHHHMQDAHVIGAPYRGHGRNPGIGSLIVVDMDLTPDAFVPATPEEVQAWIDLWTNGPKETNHGT